MKTAKFVFLICAIVIGLVSFRAGSNTQPAIISSHKVLADTLKIDSESGLIDSPSLMMIKAQCTACHSSKLILQHRFTRAGWTERIRWMQKYHKLWDLGESEKVVLDYLEKYYGPSAIDSKAAFRRAALKEVQWYRLN